MGAYLRHSGSMTLWVLMFPLLVFVVYAEDFRESEFTARLGWFILLVAFSYLVRSRLFFFILLIPFALSGVIDLLYTSTFHHQFESPLVRVLTDTDQSEALEFVGSYLNALNATVLGLYLLGLFYLGRQTELFSPQSFKSKLTVFLGLLMLVVAVQQVMFHERYRDVLPGAFGQVTDGLNKYFQVREEMKKRPQMLANFNENVTRESPKTSQTYVVVIGESAVRGHHSLYGYQRKTNPALSQVQDELFLFDDVIAPYAVTYLSLSHTLSEKTLENGKPFAESLSLVGLAKKAGFKTWWLSNQPRFEGTTASLAQVADEVKYVTNEGKTDNRLLPEVTKAIRDEAPHKVVFVHLRGSHMTYAKRYPERFDYFKGAEGVKLYTDEPSARQLEVVNAYDNSIRYTDYVLGEIIQTLKSESDGISGMVYFSDHGEEVYDHKDFIGHELKRVTPEMFEIPFIVWTNPHYQNEFKDKAANMHENRSQPFLNDDFFAFGLCFMGIETALRERALSPCDAQFQPKERRVAGRLYQDGKLLN